MDDVAWLRLLQLHDSAFPVGAYAHSNGLEAYAQDGLTVDGLAAWLDAQVAYGFGRLDLAALALAWRATSATELAALDAELEAWKTVPGLRATSLALGRRTHGVASRLWPDRLAALAGPVAQAHHAVVLGAWSRALDLPLRPTLLAGAQGSVAAALAAATRCMPLGPERAQALLVDLQPAIAHAVATVLDDPEASLWAATPGADLHALRQAGLTTRLFQS